MGEKITLGLVEEIEIVGEETKKVLAKIDTGADNNSISIKLASELKLGPLVGTKLIKSSGGKFIRPVIKGTIIIKGKKFNTTFNIANRRNLKYPVLIGKTILKKGFLIDPNKNE